MLSFGAESFVFQFTVQKYVDKVYKTVILPVVFYGRESWPVIVMEERRLRVLKNRMMRKIYEGQRNKVTGEWRRPHKEEHYGL